MDASALVSPLTESSELPGGFRIVQLSESTDDALVVRIEGTGGVIDVVFTPRRSGQPAYAQTERCNVSYSAPASTPTSPDLSAALDELVRVAGPNDRACLASARARTVTTVVGSIVLALLAVGILVACRRRWSARQSDLALVAGVLVLMVVAAWLRSRGIGGPFCESASTQRIQTGASSLWQLISFQVSDYRHPPVTSLMLHVSLWFGHGEAWLRAPFVACAVAAVPALALLVRTTSGPAPALLAAALYTLAGPMVEFGNDIGSHAVFFLVVPLVFWLCLRLLQRPSTGRAAALGLGCAVALWTHYLAPLVLVAVFVPMAWGLARDRCEPGRARRAGLLAAGIALVAGAPVLLGFVRSLVKDAGLRAVSTEAPEAVWGSATITDIAAAGVSALGGLPAVLVLVAAAVGTFMALLERRAERSDPIRLGLIAVTVAAWIVPLAVLATTPWLRMRGVYTTLALPALFAVAAHGVWCLPRAVVSRSARDNHDQSGWPALLSALMAVLLVGAMIPGVGRRLAVDHRAADRCPARVLASTIASSDLTDVVVIHGHTTSLLGYYLAGTATAHRDAEQTLRSSYYGDFTVYSLVPSTEVAAGWRPQAEERLAALVEETGPLYLVDWTHVEPAWPELERAGGCSLELETAAARLLRCALLPVR